MRLTVKNAPIHAIGNDIVYINKSDRASIKTNKVCKIAVADKWIFATVRGNQQKGHILIDQQQRLRLNVNLEQEYEFCINYKYYYFLVAPLRATSAAIRAAYLIAFISFILSLLPIALVVIDFFL